MTKRKPRPKPKPRPTRKPARVSTASRAGLPAKDSIQAIVEFRSPGRRKYRILKTTEMDAYDDVTADPSTGEKKPHDE